MKKKITQIIRSSPGHHERTAEGSIRHKKDKMRTIIASLKYTLPISLYPDLMEWVVSCINMIPNSKCPTSFPRLLLTGSRTNFKRSLRASFGEVATFLEPSQTKRKEQNAPLPRGHIGIITGRVHNNGSVRAFLLNSKTNVIRFKFIKIQLTKDITSQINEINSI